MSTIATLTFSPCIDKSFEVPELMPTRKLSCSGLKIYPGGGGINVARVIKRLGGDAAAVFPAGGYTGKSLISLLEKEGVTIRPIDTDSDTRENVMVFEQSTTHQYRFGMPAVSMNETTAVSMLNEVERLSDLRFIVISGSMPPGVPRDIFTRVSLIAKAKNARLIVDTSGEALREAVKAGPYLIKPNLRELSKLVDNPYLNLYNIPAAARQIIATHHCEVVIVSLGQAGAMLVTENMIQTLQPPTVKVNSTVGAGDSMVGGIVYALLHDEPLEKATSFGVACGTAATLRPGTDLCQADDVFRLSRQVISTYTLHPAGEDNTINTY